MCNDTIHRKFMYNDTISRDLLLELIGSIESIAHSPAYSELVRLIEDIPAMALPFNEYLQQLAIVLNKAHYGEVDDDD